MCMEQYYRLFSSYRVPGVDKDKLVDSSTNLALDPEHIIVISRNQIFELDVVVNFTRLSDDQLYHQLRRIKRQSEEEENTNASFANIGFLTSLPRDEWAKARNELMRESTNRDCLDTIERCIFVICLDKKVDPNFNKKPANATLDLSTEENKENNIADSQDGSKAGKAVNGGVQQADPLEQMTLTAFQMLHGCNSENNSGNRWFDKTMQFIISEGNHHFVTFCHSESLVSRLQLFTLRWNLWLELRAFAIRRHSGH